MSTSKKDPGEGPPRPPDDRPDSPHSPASKRLRERVSFFEKVWSGSSDDELHRDPEVGGLSRSKFTAMDMEELERSLREERRKNVGETHLEHVTLRKTGSPRHVVQMREVGPDGTIKAGLFCYVVAKKRG